MDYSKSGGAKAGKKAPRHQEHNAPGTTKNPFGAKVDGKSGDKAELLARMKAAAEARKKKDA